MLYLQQGVGIDFRDNTLRIVHLGRSFKGIVLIDYFIKKYPPSPPGKGDTDEGGIDQLVLDLRNFISRRGIKPEQIVIGLPKEKVILKEILLPAVDEKELQDMLSYEIEKHMPFTIEDVIFDYHILSREDNFLRILIGIVKRDELQKILNFMEPGQAMPAIVDITSMAAMNWLISRNNLDENNITSLVDIGEGSIEFGILEGREIKLSRSIKRTGDHLEDTYMIGRSPLSMPSSVGEEDSGHSSPDIMPEEENNLARDIIREITMALQSLPQTREERKIDDFVLTGLEAYDSFVSEYIYKQTGTKVRIVNPIKKITKEVIPGKIASSLTIATALAMRGMEDQSIMLNFIPNGKKIKGKKNYLAVTITLLVIIVLMSFGWVLGLTYENQLVASDLTKGVKRLQPDVTAVRDMSRDIEKIDQELLIIEGIVKSETGKMDLLKELTTILPADTWLDRLNVSNEKLEIDGYSDSPSNLISLLEVSPMLEKVEFGSSITKMGIGKERFKIKANIEKEKSVTSEKVNGHEKVKSDEKKKRKK